MIYSKKPRWMRIAIFSALIILAAEPTTIEAQNNQYSMILGAVEGLAGVDQSGRAAILWSGGEVKKILRGGASWVILTSEGIFATGDLRNWERRDQGLPRNTIKIYEDKKTSFLSSFQDVKDLEMDPRNPNIMAVAFKDAVYLTRNGGATWENLRMPNYRSNGLKAVAVTTIGQDLTVFVAHAIYGLYYITPGKTGSSWTEISEGLEKLETTNNTDEISDIAIRLSANSEPEIIVSQTFRKKIYRLNWSQKRFELLWSGGDDFGIIDSLSVSGNTLRFIQNAETLEFTIPLYGSVSATGIRRRQDLTNRITSAFSSNRLRPVCAVIPNQSDFINLSELWLLTPNSRSLRIEAAGLEGLYLPVNHAMDNYSLAPYLRTIKERGLNMVVVDMKDDYGRLRFSPNNPELARWGRVFQPVNIDALIRTMRDDGVYTVARVVVFKDPEAAKKDNGKYAVWDSRKNIPWEGYYDTRQKAGTPLNDSSVPKTEILYTEDPEWQILRTWYDEKWVDPYSEEFWEYIAALCEELYQRGFNEIQFDYIRFPTDGVNMGDALYRHRSQGMSMDSAIISFLRHVRQRVRAPISVCIYGANGWYRTGARTGQEVELLADWVDVICPMYYPSHFEQHFLAQNPPELRPYRIYYQGTLRNRYIARNKVIIRPWVQAFYLNVSYDRLYYNADYVRRQTEAVRYVGNGGLTYWNNSGRYEDIPLP